MNTNFAIGGLTLKAPPGGKLPSRFAGTAYSGGRIESYGCVIDLATTEFGLPMPLLYEHRRDDIIGVVEAGDRSGGRLEVTGRLFADLRGERAERIGQLAERGIVFQMSVGLFGYGEERLAAGQTKIINGKAVSGPVSILSGGRVRECSIVALGADANTVTAFFGHGGALQRAPQRHALNTAAIYAKHNSQDKRFS
jgi:hypothetical protein